MRFAICRVYAVLPVVLTCREQANGLVERWTWSVSLFDRHRIGAFQPGNYTGRPGGRARMGERPARRADRTRTNLVSELRCPNPGRGSVLLPLLLQANVALHLISLAAVCIIFPLVG